MRPFPLPLVGLRGVLPVGTAGGSVCANGIHDLSHHVPGRAAREFEQAWKARDKGALEKAAHHFEAAIAIDPEFCAALNDLGTTYLKLDKLDNAIEQFNSAIAVDAHEAMPYSNLALAYLKRNQYSAATHLARQAVALDQTLAHGLLILGASLVLDHKFTAEAERSLTRAADEFAQADYWLAVGLVVKGDLPAAREHLRQDLASGDKTAVNAVKSLLERLEHTGEASLVR